MLPHYLCCYAVRTSLFMLHPSCYENAENKIVMPLTLIHRLFLNGCEQRETGRILKQFFLNSSNNGLMKKEWWRPRNMCDVVMNILWHSTRPHIDWQGVNFPRRRRRKNFQRKRCDYNSLKGWLTFVRNDSKWPLIGGWLMPKSSKKVMEIFFRTSANKSVMHTPTWSTAWWVFSLH